MGQQSSNSKISVVTLNYSGIFLSPFEFYASDNWQQLERIGRIFEFELKKQYQRKMNKEYCRSEFEWDVGNIDKVIHSDRYSPLYASEQNRRQKQFAGISSNGRLMNEQQFRKEWQIKWGEVKKKKQKDSDWEKALELANKNPQQVQDCKNLDFLCYKSIVKYLYTRDNGQQTLLSYQDNLNIQFEEIITQKKTKLVDNYREFMTDYFLRIDQERKINLTQENLFQKRQLPSIIVFTEANSNFRKKLSNFQSCYLVLGPNKQDKNKQTLLLVLKDLYFVSQNYHFKEVKQQILQSFKKKHAQKFKNYWSYRLKQQQNKKVKLKRQEFIKKLNSLQQFLKWTQDWTIVDFPQHKVVLGGFHLSSKQQLNVLQVQILGCIIQHYRSQGYKFIFSGDFNSYITTVPKDDENDLLSFFEQEERNVLVREINFYPKHPKIITTKKKRTIMQPQTNKMNKLSQKTIDQIVSNFRIINDDCRVGQINDSVKSANNNNSFLPHKDHPYDHFLVEAILDLERKAYI